MRCPTVLAADQIDQRAYIVDAMQRLERVTRGYAYKIQEDPQAMGPAWTCYGAAAYAICRDYLERFIRRDFSVIAPYQFSASNPLLEDYVGFRARCSTFSFETTMGAYVPPARATRNFALYRLLSPNQEISRGFGFAYRAERYVTDPNIDPPVVYPGFITLFAPDRCLARHSIELIAPYAFEEHDPRAEAFNEFVRLDGRVMILIVHSARASDRPDETERVSYVGLFDLGESAELTSFRGFIFTSTGR